MTLAVAERPKPRSDERQVEDVLAEQARKLHESQPSLSIPKLIRLVVAAVKGKRGQHVQL